MDQEHVEVVLVTVPAVMALVSQVAAIFGKPKLVANLTIASKVWDFLAGNYRRARNTQ